MLETSIANIYSEWVGALVMGDNSSLRGNGFESRQHVLDGHDIFNIDLLLKLYCLFENTENKRKRGQSWPIQITFTQKIFVN